MQYMILIYSEVEVENEAPMDAWWAFDGEIKASGQFVGGEALQLPNTAKTVRVRNGETLITDGPFAETKEILGGFYIVDVDTEEEALAWAAKIPSTPYGSTEVRPVIDFSQEMGEG